jgi:hypothetical protein
MADPPDPVITPERPQFTTCVQGIYDSPEKLADKRIAGAAKNRTRAFYIVSSIEESPVRSVVESILEGTGLSAIVTEDARHTPSLVQAERDGSESAERFKWKGASSC